MYVFDTGRGGACDELCKAEILFKVRFFWIRLFSCKWPLTFVKDIWKFWCKMFIEAVLIFYLKST